MEKETTNIKLNGEKKDQQVYKFILAASIQSFTESLAGEIGKKKKERKSILERKK